MEDSSLDGVVEGGKHARMCFVLEANGQAGWSVITFEDLRLSPASNLVEVEGWYVDAVTRSQRRIVEVIDVLRGGELFEIRLEQVNWRLVHFGHIDHLVAFDRVVLGRFRTGHHLLAVDVGHEGHLDIAVVGAHDLVSPVVVHIVQEELAHGELH